MKRPPNVNNSPQASVLTEVFQEGWRGMKEKTSSGVSGVHFGHVKSCAQSENTSDFEATMSHTPCCTGHSPKDWRVVVNAMIAKKGKGNLIEDLRTINLMEACFNFNNKFMARSTMKCAEENKLLPAE